MARDVHQETTGVEHWVEHRSIRLYVWEKFAGTPARKPVVVLAHGSATAGRESFDLQVPGRPSYSFMDFLARQGFDVFAPDVRGFGRSARPEGHLSTLDASEDLAAVVDHLLHLRDVPAVHLVGWSWGTQYGGMFVMAHPGKVERYVSYAQMHVGSPDVARRRARIDSFRKAPYMIIPEAGWKARFTSMTPPHASEPDVVEAYAQAAARVEARTPTGPQLDMVTILPMVDARLLPVPTMVVHGEHDDVADLDGLWPFFRNLPSADKHYVVVPGGGHMLHLQKPHLILHEATAAFLRSR